MSDAYAVAFPIGRVPDPDSVPPDYLAKVTERMQAERKAVAPNPLAQALYPPIDPKRYEKRAK